MGRDRVAEASGGLGSLATLLKLLVLARVVGGSKKEMRLAGWRGADCKGGGTGSEVCLKVLGFGR
jgi:hypothetical protein